MPSAAILIVSPVLCTAFFTETRRKPPLKHAPRSAGGENGQKSLYRTSTPRVCKKVLGSTMGRFVLGGVSAAILCCVAVSAAKNFVVIYADDVSCGWKQLKRECVRVIVVQLWKDFRILSC